MAVPKTKENRHLAVAWRARIIDLRRQASVPLEYFLLPADDPRIQRAREDLSTVKQTKDGAKRAPTDWIKCESRHARARDEEHLGAGRPLTSWLPGGAAPVMPAGAWTEWGAVQTERVLDLMDVSVLRCAMENVDVGEQLPHLAPLPIGAEAYPEPNLP